MKSTFLTSSSILPTEDYPPKKQGLFTRHKIAAFLFLFAICTSLVFFPSTAHAASWENCEPNQSLSVYQTNNCAYSGSAPYLQGPTDFVYINVYIDPATIPTSQTKIRNAISAAVDNWNNSGAHVRLSIVGSPPTANPLTIAGATNGTNFTTSCGTAWGQSWYPGNAYYQKVILNSLIFSTCGSQDTWTGVTVHEMGHTMGLGHNNYNNGVVNMRMATNAVTLLGGSPMVRPQFTDYFIFNKIYTAYPTQCYYTPSNSWCNGMDPYEQSCPDFPQNGGPISNPYGTVTLHWSGTHCLSNWASATATNGAYRIYQIQIRRDGGTTDGPALTIEDIPYATAWYTNIVYAPNALTHACVSYVNTSTKAVTSFYCS